MNWLKLKCQTCLREGCVDQTLDEDERHGEGEQLPALAILALRSGKTQKNIFATPKFGQEIWNLTSVFTGYFKLVTSTVVYMYCMH